VIVATTYTGGLLNTIQYAATALSFSPTAPWAVLVVILLSMITASVIGRFYSVSVPVGRYRSIEGLRGYLALFVFLHHACIWYFYQHDHVWAVPPSRLYAQLGQASVALFFMITGFLFFSKLFDLRDQGRCIDWADFLKARIRRLLPLYLFAMAMLFLMVAYISGFQLHEDGLKLIKHGLAWLFFTISGAPDINGIEHTFTMVAGVTWSLPYEWLFYLALPLLGWFFGVNSSKKWLFLGGLALIFLLTRKPVFIHTISFAGGLLASWAARSKKLRQFSSSIKASWLVCLLMVLEVSVFDTAYGWVQSSILMIAFSLVAAGNHVFGLLEKSFSYILGQMAYSIYMLHGLLLFFVFNFLYQTTFIEHWYIVFLITPILIVVSYFSFRLFESALIKNYQSKESR
jgi:peptidoglycan/LPS O-acetylase OafA/YrhL